MRANLNFLTTELEASASQASDPPNDSVGGNLFATGCTSEEIILDTPVREGLS